MKVIVDSVSGENPSSWFEEGFLLTGSWHGRDSVLVWFSSYEDINPVMGDPHLLPYLNLITFQSLHLQIPLHLGIRASSYEIERYKHSVL